MDPAVEGPDEWREVGGLRFSQVEVSTVFSDNRHVMRLVKEWMTDRRKLEEGTVKLEVAEVGTEVVSMNNRRLLAAKILKSVVGGEVWLPVVRIRDESKLSEIRRRLEERKRLGMEDDEIVTKIKKKGNWWDREQRRKGEELDLPEELGGLMQ